MFFVSKFVNKSGQFGKIGRKSEIETSSTPPKPPKPEEEIPRKYTKEINGPKGLEPTRYGDWERKGICYDF